MSTKKRIEDLKEMEEAIIAELKVTEPGSARREDLAKDLKMMQEIRLKEEESEVNTVNDFINRVTAEKRVEADNLKSKRELIGTIIKVAVPGILTVYAIVADANDKLPFPFSYLKKPKVN